MRFNFNGDLLRGEFKTLRRKRTRCARGVLHWSTGGPDAQLGQETKSWLILLVAVNLPRGTGYSAVVASGVLYEAAHWTEVTQHCGGSDWGNTESYGVSIMYPGPSAKPRGIPGEKLLAHSRLGKAWYPPISEEDILHAAWAFRRVKDEMGLVEVKGHWEINGAKNDPHPIDMARFRRLVFDEVAWREASAAL